MQSNPFSTRYIQPGAIPYHLFDGGSVSELTSRFLKLPSKRGCIVGPHGSGKSTLVASLVHELQCQIPDVRIQPLRFSTEQQASKSLNASLCEWTHSSIAILDGFEQLALWSRLKVAWVAHKKRVRILATAHQSISGFETLWCTSVSDDSAYWVIEQLLQDSNLPQGEAQNMLTQLLASDDWKQSRQKHGQNLRETLFDMYDWWQKR